MALALALRVMSLTPSLIMRQEEENDSRLGQFRRKYSTEKPSGISGAQIFTGQMPSRHQTNSFKAPKEYLVRKER